MSKHIKRVTIGIYVSIVIGLFIMVLMLLHMMYIKIKPHILEHSEFLALITAGFLLFIVVMYILGYIVNDGIPRLSKWFK